MNFRLIRIATLSVLLASSSLAAATIAEDWEAGKQAFSAGDYESAIVFFETARDAGLDGPAVHYNIAVVQFKLERFTAAQYTFETIARRFPKMRGLAEYNLGLVARRLGENNKAREHFLSAYELSPDNREIRVLASRQLRGIQPEVRTASRWTGAFGARAGHDDNVALLDEAGLPAGTTTDSPMLDLFGMFRGPLNTRNGFRAEGSAYLVKYLDANDFDQAEFRGKAFYEWRPSDWRVQFGIHAAAGMVGGDAFDRKVGTNARVVRYLGDSSAIDLRYTYDDVSEAESVFAGVAGSRQQFDTRYRWYGNGHQIQLRYLFESNDRLDPGASPDRNRFAFDYRYRPESGLGYEAGVDLRSSEYDEVAIPRTEDLLTLRAALTYMFRNDWLFLVDYRNAENDSSDPTFSYDRGQFTLGAMKYF